MQYFKNNYYWAIILGGSSGFGFATAAKLASEGMNLCLLYRERKSQIPALEKKLKTLKANNIQILHFNSDASSDTERAKIMDVLKTKLEGGKVRLLLHSIARGSLKKLSHENSIQEPDFDAYCKDKAIANHFKTMQQLTRQIDYGSNPLSKKDFQLTAAYMAWNLWDWTSDLHNNHFFAKDARILALTSEGSRKAWKGYTAVSMAKAALEALCKNIAAEFAPYGIRCNVLQPGITDTSALRLIPGNDLLKGHAISRNPFGRLTTPADVANVVYLMCRDESSWINGATIPVDGGEQNS